MMSRAWPQGSIAEAALTQLAPEARALGESYVAGVNARLAELGDAGERYEAALRTKAQALADSNHPAGKQLVALADGEVDGVCSSGRDGDRGDEQEDGDKG